MLRSHLRRQGCWLTHGISGNQALFRDVALPHRGDDRLHGKRYRFPRQNDYFLPLATFFAGAAFGEGAGLAAGFAGVLVAVLVTGFFAAAIILGSLTLSAFNRF